MQTVGSELRQTVADFLERVRFNRDGPGFARAYETDEHSLPSQTRAAALVRSARKADPLTRIRVFDRDASGEIRHNALIPSATRPPGRGNQVEQDQSSDLPEALVAFVRTVQ